MNLIPLTFRDKILPSQPAFQELFEGGEQDFYAALHDTLMRFGSLKLPTEEFQLEQSEEVTIEAMASSPTILRFLQLLILLKQPRRILELGTFIGISAMSMARVLPDDGRVITMEKYSHFADLARRNFLKNGLSHKIQLIQGDAFEELRTLGRTERFEMIFLDGNKERYGDYLPLLEPLLGSQGLLVVDDVFFHGDVLNEQPKSAKGLGVKGLLEAVERKEGYQKVILPIGNGLMLMVKEN